MRAKYTTAPSGSIRRLACVAEQALRDDPTAPVWLLAPRPGTDSSRDFYELLDLSVMASHNPSAASHWLAANRSITVNLGPIAGEGKPLRIRQVVRTVTPCWGNSL